MKRDPVDAKARRPASAAFTLALMCAFGLAGPVSAQQIRAQNIDYDGILLFATPDGSVTCIGESWGRNNPDGRVSCTAINGMGPDETAFCAMTGCGRENHSFGNMGYSADNRQAAGAVVGGEGYPFRCDILADRLICAGPEGAFSMARDGIILMRNGR